MTTWLDPLDPAIRSAVVSGGYGKGPHSEHGLPVPTLPTIDTIAEALAQASDVLDRLTGFFFHPALQVEEDFTATPRATSLAPTFGPLRSVLSITRLSTGVPVDVPPDAAGDAWTGPNRWWTVFAGEVYFSPSCTTPLSTWLWGWCGCQVAPQELLRLKYNAGSTITASARKAVLALAHEYWLATSRCDECDNCSLPDRTTAVVRAGLAYTIADSEDPLNPGHTGILSVDAWVRMTNPHRATTRSGVWTPDRPPPVVHSVKTARPIFPVPAP